MAAKSQTEKFQQLSFDESGEDPPSLPEDDLEYESKAERFRSLGGGTGIKSNVLPVFKEPPEPEIEFDDQKIYLMECNGYTKIGISSDPERRRSNLQGANPFKVTLHSTIKSDNAKRTEEELHMKLDQYRAEGGAEWFDLPDAVWSYLDKQDVLLIPDVWSLQIP